MYVNAYRGIIICRMPDLLQRKREKKMDITELIGKLDEISASGDHELYMKTITEYISSYDSEHPEDLNGRSVLYNELGAHLRQTGTEDLGKKAFESAAEMLEKLLEENPGDHTITMNLATTVNNLAGAYRLRKEYEKALAAFDRSMEIYKSLKDVPDNLFPSVYNNKGLVYLDLGEREKATECFDTALSLVEGEGYARGTTLWNMGFAYYRMGQYEKSAALYREAASCFEKDGGSEELYKNSVKMAETLEAALKK